MGEGLIKILPIGLHIFISCADSANFSAGRSSLHRSICIRCHELVAVANTELHAEVYRKDMGSNSLGQKCHLCHHMPDTSKHRNKLCCLIFFYKTKSRAFISSVPTDAAETVLLNINKQCLKYSTFCTLSTFSPHTHTHTPPTLYSALYFSEKSLCLSFTSVKSFKQAPV